VRAERRLNDPDLLLFQELPHGTAPLPIAITDQHTTTSQDTIEPIGQMTHGLFGRCCFEVAPKVTASLIR